VRGSRDRPTRSHALSQQAPQPCGMAAAGGRVRGIILAAGAGTPLNGAVHPLVVANPESNDPEMGHQEMKVRVRKGLVVGSDKSLSRRQTDGENVGIAKFSADGASRLVSVMRRLVEADRLSAWAPRAFRQFARNCPLYAIGTRGLPWTEIDTPDDYRY